MLPLLLAKKLFFPSPHTPTWNKLALLTTSTIALSIAALSIAGALLDAFHQETLITFQNIQSDITVLLPQNINLEVNREALSEILADNYQYSWEASIILANPDQKKIATAQLLYKNFSKNPSFYRLPDRCPENAYVEPSDNKIIIGADLAKELQVNINDNVLICTAMLFENPEELETGNNIVSVEKIIKSGIDELDNSYIWCNQKTFEHLTNQKQPNKIDINSTPKQNPTSLMNLLKTKLKLPIHTWLDLYPTLQSALALEKSIFFLVLLLVVAIIVLLLPSLITLLIEHKKNSITILLISGIPLINISNALIIFGLSLISIAQLAGIFTAYFICLCINYITRIPLPSNYYHRYIMLSLSPITTLIIIITSSILGGLVVWYTAQSLSYKKISYLLKKGL